MLGKAICRAFERGAGKECGFLCRLVGSSA